MKLFVRCLDRGCSRDAKRTKKLLQSEYEALYTGSELQIENRYSVLISMIFIILMYSTTIPTLYFAGFLLCVVQYWTDKVLFLRFYKTPPKYGISLAQKAIGIIQYAILVHLIMGVYMMSNPEIFPKGEQEDN